MGLGPLSGPAHAAAHTVAFVYAAAHAVAFAYAAAHAVAFAYAVHVAVVEIPVAIDVKQPSYTIVLETISELLN